MKRKIMIASIALLAGFLSVPAQNRISLQENDERKNASFDYPGFEQPKLPAIKKIQSKQDGWEPDTVYFYFTSFPCSRSIRRYNSQGLLTANTNQIQGTNSWENTSTDTYTYDSNDHLLTTLSQNWKNSSWENAATVTYTYDFNNNVLTEIDQKWENDSWVDGSYHSQSSYTYDSNNNVLSKIQQSWTNSWVSLDSLTYIYDSNNHLLIKLHQSWENNSWNNFSLVTYTYDSSNNVLTYLYQTWDSESNSWVNGESDTYTYDSNHHLLTSRCQLWGYYSLTDFLVTYTYDSNDNLLTATGQEWENDSWVNDSSATYTYDSSNNLLTERVQRWDNDSWINSTLYQWAYDENGNGLSAESQIWRNGSWQPSDNSIYSFVTIVLYYNHRQSAVEGRGCDKITASYLKVSGDVTAKEEVKAILPVQIYSAGKTIHVNSPNGKSAIVTVYGIDGIKVAEQTMTNQSIALEIPVSGFYLVSVKAGNEKPVTEKVIVK